LKKNKQKKLTEKLKQNKQKNQVKMEMDTLKEKL
jgi:hypothetical protein